MIDPELHYCNQCRHSFHLNFWHKLLLFLCNEKIVVCPVCGNRMTFRIIAHFVKISSEPVLDENIWRRG